MEKQRLFVLHSPYPNGTWRGLENCLTGTDTEGPLLFETPERAQAWLHADPVAQQYWKVVAVELTIPAVGEPLDAVT